MQPTTEQDIRTKTASIPLDWMQSRSNPFLGSSKEEFCEVIEAAHVVADEGGLALHRWIDAGRRAGMSWSEIGATLGISKQAAQQRFRSAAPPDDEAGEADSIKVRVATAFNEVRILEEEGRDRNELIRTGFLALVFRRSEREWEYHRVVAVSPHVVMPRMSSEGWVYVSSWFPFHYFKRATD